MWSYYGAKTTIVKYYPRPLHDKIIEPFAGSAKYALRYFEKDVLLIDKYDVIVRLWKYLQQCSPADILSLPEFNTGDNINSHNFVCEEEKILVGFMIGYGSQNFRQTATKRLTERPNYLKFQKKKIATQLFKIKHWQIRCESYNDIKNEKATWFIDPPYQYGGHVYPHSNKNIDFNHLSTWSMGRQGQVIVCENTKADWMNFKPLVTHYGINTNHEAIWTNQEKISYLGNQENLIFQ